jgi:hypothetical protein
MLNTFDPAAWIRDFEAAGGSLLTDKGRVGLYIPMDCHAQLAPMQAQVWDEPGCRLPQYDWRAVRLRPRAHQDRPVPSCRSGRAPARPE